MWSASHRHTWSHSCRLSLYPSRIARHTTSINNPYHQLIIPSPIPQPGHEATMPTPPANSLLNLLNPYASVAQSSYPRDRDAGERVRLEPLDSPSAELLRELQSDTADGNNVGPIRSRSPPTSPTPTPRRPFVINPAEDTSSDDEPPRSLLFQASTIPHSQTPVRAQTPPRDSAGVRPVKGKGRGEPSQSPGPWRRRPTSPSESSRQSSPERSKRPLSNLERVQSHASTATASTEPPTPSSTSEEAPTPAARTATLEPLRRASPPSPTPQSPPIPGPSRRTKGRGKHKYHSVASDEPDRGPVPSIRKAGLSEYNQALWAWANVVNLDQFLQEVYEYYKNKGYWCIVLAQVLNLM